MPGHLHCPVGAVVHEDPLMLFATDLYPKLSYTVQCKCLMGASQVHLTRITSARGSLHSAQMPVPAFFQTAKGF